MMDVLLIPFLFLVRFAFASQHETYKLVVPGSKVVLAGEGIALKCSLQRIDGTPVTVPLTSSNFKWIRKSSDGSEQILSKGRALTRYVSKDNSFLLMIDHPRRPDDEGTFECRVEFHDIDTNDVVLISQELVITLREPVSFENVDAVQHPWSTEDEAKIRCDVKGEPTPVVAWVRNGDNILDEGRYSFEDEGRTLVITGFSPERDDGIPGLIIPCVYICRAILDDGSLKDFEINVTAYTRPEITIPVVSSLEGLEGKPVKFVCAATGYPAPQFDWLKTPYEDAAVEEVLTASDRILFPQPGTLEIRGLMRSDAGTYTCRAKNDVGHVASSGLLAIFPKPTIGHITESIQKAARGTSFTLECSFTGDEVSSYWQHNGIRYNSTADDKIVFSRKDGSMLLTVNHASVEDKGDYECHVDNKAGAVAKSVQVQVTHAPEMMEYTPTPLKSFKGNEVVLTCSVEAIPEPTWHWQNPAKNDVYGEETGDKLKSTLKFQTNVASDYGIYSCIADNGISPPAERAVTVLEVVMPQIPDGITLTEGPTSVDITIQNYAELSGEREAASELVLQYLDLQDPEADSITADRFSDSDKHNLQTTDGTVRLTNLLPETTYALRIAGKNIAGVSAFSEPVTFTTKAPQVPEMPDILQKEEKCHASPCVVTWKPPKSDMGSDIIYYRVRFQKVHVMDGNQHTVGKASKWHQLESHEQIYTFPALDPDSQYDVEIMAVNRIGESEPAHILLRTGAGTVATGVSSAAVIAIVVILVLIVLVIVDVACYYMNHCGLLMCLCTCCGKRHDVKVKGKEVAMEEGHLKSDDDKQPLKDIHDGEKEPEDKGEPNEVTPMILEEQAVVVKSELASVKNSSV